ncbi:hypothetical protein K438DRAFT_2016018 [Mycena galopus ATCC 62051]|nr:hypothetical protein K438DRAFT_2016018 [Mycena galopus ATCC 62051]
MPNVGKPPLVAPYGVNMETPARADKEKLWALVQKGREANDNVRCKLRPEHGAGTKRKRKRPEREDGDEEEGEDNEGGERKAKKTRWAEGDDNTPLERPKPKPLYRSKKTTAAAGPPVTNEGAAP